MFNPDATLCPPVTRSRRQHLCKLRQWSSKDKGTNLLQHALARTSIDPRICFGKPCIRGHRIWVSLILDFLASGWTFEDIMRNYDLEEADVLACIAYGAEMARERYFEIPIEAAQ